MRRAPLRLAALIVGLALAAGCSSSSTGPGEDDDYPSRGTPEGVLAKLVMAYEAEDADAFVDCLSESFVFFLNEDECIGNPDLPNSWDRATEEQIHRAMFGDAAGVDSVDLSLTTFGTPGEIPGPEPGDPSGWQYDEDVELLVHVSGGTTAVYTTTVGARFSLQVDPVALVATGDTLWEIRQWEDVDPFMPPAGRLSISWGSLKNIFREQD
ncbi:MAG: hypothetical protein GF405_03650 [Candidatus Eisenbacteria bacterium]|nr:hypothetical protein [Candidatus Eisenbacteria bacterium]